MNDAKNIKKFAWWGSCMMVVALSLTGCAPEAGTSPSPLVTAEAPATDEQAPASDEEAAPATQPRVQAEECEWDAAASMNDTKQPAGQEGELRDLIVGSWQHTHYDEGNGYTALDGEDIRYVFPSADRLLYCQHIVGITDHAQNATDITWEGTRIVVPGGAPGFEVVAWNDETMVWVNRMDNSHYLLQRR
jgi:hypothetical protein